MVSTAVSRRQRREAQRRTQRSHRRTLTVIISALTTIALFAGYCAADITDVAPGLLTLKPVAAPVFADPATAKSGGTVAGTLNANRAIDSTAASALVNELLSAQGVGNDTSVIIEDAQGTVAAEHESNTPREPASTLKTLTALAASSTLNMASTLDTQVFLTQSDDGTNTLTLKGNGDMLLSAGDSDANHTNGRAGLNTLAKATVAALAQRGITSVNLEYDDTLFGDSRIPAGLSEGGAASDVAAKFAELLQSNGMAVTGDVTANTAPSGETPLASVSSATLSEIMAYTLRHSDNTLAEEFGRLTALAKSATNSPEGGTEAVKSTLNDLGLDTSGLTMADCSGLSPGSRLTVRTLAAVQQRNLTTESGAAGAEGLSIAGLVGTAQDRYTDDAVAGLLRVKTGSLGTVTSMAGNVSRTNGGALSFAVVVNNPEDYAAARSAIDSFITKLAGL